jgi:arylsulfatase A-like enzyme/Flp pilus assembly protein TadD
LGAGRTRRVLAGACALLALGWLGWLGWGRRHATRRSPRPPNVLLVTIDTLRADALGAYGNARAETPWIDRLAASGVRFDDAHAQNVVTLPSHANILSGLYPFQHGVRDNSGFRFPSGLPTLATLLQEAGYRTGAFISAFPLDSRFGLDRGFDIYDDDFVDAVARPAFLEQERPGPKTVARAIRWVGTSRARPWFCWVHVYEPHFPYRPPGALVDRFRGDPYEGEVAAADAALGPLLGAVLSPGADVDSHTLVVLTADHGESLGEHGEATHGVLAYEATLRVPLVLYLRPELKPRIVTGLARHIDILPTVLDVLGLPPPAGLPGRSLLPQAEGLEAAPVSSYFEALSGALNRDWAPLYGLIRGEVKYIDLPIPEIYDLRRDPAEVRNLIRDPAAPLARMRLELAAFRDEDRGISRHPDDDDTRARLLSLGYASGAAVALAARYTEADDPKVLIGMDAEMHRIASLYLAGDLSNALSQCRALVAKRPGMALSLVTLAQLEHAARHPASAIDDLEKARALRPEDGAIAALLGSWLTQAGRAREAAELLARRVGRGMPNDVDIRVALSLAYARLGRTADSLALLQPDRGERSPAPLLVTRGTVLLMAGDRAGARRAFEDALALRPGAARALSSLAFMDAEDGRSHQATDEWQRALALDGSERARLLALISLLETRGRSGEARMYRELLDATRIDPQNAGQ